LFQQGGLKNESALELLLAALFAFRAGDADFIDAG
jgi:hypothetical protein